MDLSGPTSKRGDGRVRKGRKGKYIVRGGKKGKGEEGTVKGPA